jgi:hypothetical protein
MICGAAGGGDQLGFPFSQHTGGAHIAYDVLCRRAASRSPDRHGFDEWAGDFSTKRKCEQALSREQNNWYDVNPDQSDPDKLDVVCLHGAYMTDPAISRTAGIVVQGCDPKIARTINSQNPKESRTIPLIA